MPPEAPKRTISKILRGSLTKEKAENLDKQLKSMRATSFFLSVVNRIELLGFKGLTIREEKRFENLIGASRIIMLHNGIVEETIALRNRYSNKLPDAIIAASAISIDATLMTSDLSDFGKKIC